MEKLRQQMPALFVLLMVLMSPDRAFADKGRLVGGGVFVLVLMLGGFAAGIFLSRKAQKELDANGKTKDFYLMSITGSLLVFMSAWPLLSALFR